MRILPGDMSELKRLSTNAYEADKKFLNRIITGIMTLEKEVAMLKNEIQQFNKEDKVDQ